MHAPHPARLAGETRAERERLAAILGGLAPEHWSAPSLCAGWRVREAVAHITMPFRTGPLGYMAGLARAGFSFHRYADRDARSTAHRCGQAELVDLVRRNIDNPWQPPGDGGAGAGALSHDVIHGLDVTEPLGLTAAPTVSPSSSGQCARATSGTSASTWKDGASTRPTRTSRSARDRTRRR